MVADLVTHYERYGDLILKVYAESAQVEGLAEVARKGRAYHVRWCEEAFAAALDQLGHEPLLTSAPRPAGGPLRRHHLADPAP